MLKIKKLRDTAKTPTRGTAESAGLDLYANIDASITIKPSETVKFPTGIAIALPNGTAGFIFARSSLGVKHNITPANAVGVIDSDYRGEISVSLTNHSDKIYTVNPDDRIAQLVIIKTEYPEIVLCDELDQTERAGGGFGSTGR